MLDRGWALGAEVAGVTAREQLGPHRKPSVAWVRRTADETLLLIGGRQFGTPADPAVSLGVRANGHQLPPISLTPGFFMRVVSIPAATFASGQGYLPVEFSAAGGGGAQVPVALEQFDLQGSGVPMIGVDAGWQEPEYNPATGRSWRWMSDRATVWVRPVGRDVTLVLEGESPLRYFDSAPVVTVTIAGRQVARFSPTADFREVIVLPGEALASAEGRVAIESDKVFVPGDRDGSGDKRRLALRVYGYSAN
jgi:hypothetical protein